MMWKLDHDDLTRIYLPIEYHSKTLLFSGTLEGSTDDYPRFWSSLIDDAVKTRDPISELRPSLDGVWNEFAFPLMCADPSGLPASLIVGYVEDQSFNDARLFPPHWIIYT